MLTLLNKALEANKLELPTEQKQKLVHYLNLMLEWNRIYNLTSITNEREMVYFHIIDSLIVEPFLSGQSMLDVGTGAGLPGLPLAIIRPDTSWVLLDKAGKKTRFLTQAVAELGITNVKIANTRCEDYNSTTGFDNILSRAYGTLQLFAESTKHLLAQDGKLIAMKGKYPQDEVDSIPTDFKLADNKRVQINGVDVERHIIVLERNHRD